MSEKRKILITGASGFLGYHLLRSAWKHGYVIYGLHHRGAIDFPYSTSVRLDLRNYIELGNVMDEIEPDVVIHAAALADSNACQHDPELSYAINVDAARDLAGICSDHQIPFVFTSTDLVFDGSRGNYTEDDRPNPLMTYGEHKLRAEQEVIKVYPQSVIVRCPLMFGMEAASDKNYFSNFLKSMRAGQSNNLFYDEYRSVCGAKSIAEGILNLSEKATGLVHLAGAERISRYDFGLAIADAFGLDKTILHSMSQQDIKMAAPRPADVSLNIHKAQSLGYSPLGYKEELKQIAQGNYLS